RGEAGGGVEGAGAVGREQEAKALELRAAVSLARLRHGQGKRAVARTLLGEVYNWFSEGFDTAELSKPGRCCTSLDSVATRNFLALLPLSPLPSGEGAQDPIAWLNRSFETAPRFPLAVQA